ncbi:MAG: hypothetical protein AB7P52_15870 [Alphaproteobacteria bacterium]
MSHRVFARRRCRAAITPLVLACALALLAPATSAQEDEGPIRLVPQRGEGAGAPAELPPAVTGEPKRPAASGGDAVVVGELEAVGPDSLGLSDVPGGALPRTLWQGSARRFIEALVARLPSGPPSPAMRELMIRLLATPGPPPTGPEGGATPGSFLSARASALAAIGEYQIAGALLREGAAAGLAESLWRRLESDLHFLAGGDYGPACNQARSEVQRESSAYWQQVLVFCQVVAGETEAARTSLDLLREGGVDDPAFFALADALLGGKAELAALPDPTPLHFAMLRQAKLPVPADAVAGANPALLRLVAASAESPIEVRIAAAEAAEAAGTVPAESVGRFYMAAEFKKEPRADPVAAAESLPGPLARALLFRAATVETAPEARARLLQAGFAQARKDGMFPTFARAAFVLVSKLEAGPAFTWFAGDAARALLAASEPAMAANWYRLATQQATVDPEADATALSLWPIMTLAGEAPARGFDANRFEAWLEAEGGAGVPSASAKANLMLTLLQAAGSADVPPSVWRSLALGVMNEEAHVATPAASFALDDAAGSKRVGEAVLLGLVALGNAGPSAAATATLGQVVKSLTTVGLGGPARALALEAALGKGL